MAAGGVAFVGGAAGIGGDDLDRLEGNIELFGGDLQERGLDALAEFDLAGEDRDRAVGVDADPGVEIGRSCEAARRLWRRRCCRRASCAKASDSEKLTTSAPPPASTLAAIEN